MDSSLVSRLRCETGLKIPASLGCGVLGERRLPQERDANAVPPGKLFRPNAPLIGLLSSPTPEGPLLSWRPQVPSSPFDDRSLQIKALPLCLQRSFLLAGIARQLLR